MVKNVCHTYLKGLKEFHFKMFLALTLASGATRPCLGVPEHPLNPQFQGLKIDLCDYRRPNYFPTSAPDYLQTKLSKISSQDLKKFRKVFPSMAYDRLTEIKLLCLTFTNLYSMKIF